MYSFDQITADNNDKYTYDVLPSTLFHNKDGDRSTAHQIAGQWFVKRRVKRKECRKKLYFCAMPHVPPSQF